jgi:hypothetical protein
MPRKGNLLAKLHAATPSLPDETIVLVLLVIESGENEDDDEDERNDDDVLGKISQYLRFCRACSEKSRGDLPSASFSCRTASDTFNPRQHPTPTAGSAIPNQEALPSN